MTVHRAIGVGHCELYGGLFLNSVSNPAVPVGSS